MHILPRSRCGIYGFAGIAWLAGAVICWSSAAPVPRFVMDPVEKPYMLLSDDGRRILYYEIGYTDTPLWFATTQQPRAQGPLRIFDSSDGKLLVSHEPTRAGVALIPEQALLIVREQPGSRRPFTLIDLITGERTPMSWAGVEDYELCAAHATADGRFIVIIARQADQLETIWWDRVTQLSREFPGLEPLALAPNGRWITRGDGDCEYCVREPNSARILCRSPDLTFGIDKPFGVRLDRTGPELFVELYENSSNVCIKRTALAAIWPQYRPEHTDAGGTDSQMLVTWLAARPLPLEDWINKLPLIGRHYFAEEVNYCAVVDSQTADVVSTFQIPYCLEQWLSPDGRSLLARRSSDDRWYMWDVPPRKSTNWMWAALAWALPVFAIARWRVRSISRLES